MKTCTDKLWPSVNVQGSGHPQMPSRPCFALALLIEKIHCIIRREWSSLRAEPFHSHQILYQTAPPYVVPESLSSEILQASERTLGARCWKEESLFAMWSHNVVPRTKKCSVVRLSGRQSNRRASDV